jgi:hypothetical protein
MSRLSAARISRAINSGDIDTVYGIIDNEYSKKSEDGDEFDLEEHKIRMEFVDKASWAIPDPEAIEKIGDFIWDKIALEVGAGNGLWAALLKQYFKEKGYGGTIIATDNFSLKKEFYYGYTEVKNFKAVDAVNEHPEATVLILIWPPYNTPMAFDALTRFKGDYVVYIGEGEGGCTGDDNFHQCLLDEWNELDESNELDDPHEIRRWTGKNDSVFFYQRK